MPWLSEAKKGVTSCEKLRGLANTNRSADTRMGKPIPQGIPWATMEQTWGTETSHYPQEEKTIVIPRVVASEKGRA